MPERRVAGDRRHPLHLPVATLPQPDETTCGPTCLHAIYRYWGDDEPLQSVIERMWHREHGGTYAVFLGCDALRKGYRARIYTYNITVFDPTWFTRPHVDIGERLARAARAEGRRANPARDRRLPRVPAQRRPPAAREPVAASARRHPALPAADPDRPVVDVSLPVCARARRGWRAGRRSRPARRPLRRHRRLGRRAAARAGRRSVPAQSVRAVARVLDQRRSRARRDPARHRHARRQPARRVSAPRRASTMNVLVVVNHAARLAVRHRRRARRHRARIPDRSRVRREHVGAHHQPVPDRPLPGPRLLRVAARRGAGPPRAARGEDARRPAGAPPRPVARRPVHRASAARARRLRRRRRAASMPGSAATRRDATSRSRSNCSRRCAIPLLQAQFERDEGRGDSAAFASRARTRYRSPSTRFSSKRRRDYMRRGTRSRAPEPPPASPAIAILFDDDEPDPPSNAAALEKFTVAARALGMRPAFIGRDDIERLDEFDGLFIRDTTERQSLHVPVRASRGCRRPGRHRRSRLDPEMHEQGVPERAAVAAQRTRAEDADRPSRQRRPDRPGARAAVHPEAARQRVLARRDEDRVRGGAARLRSSTLFAQSDLVVAQEWLPTEFDWRVGVFDRRPLFVCKYFMAQGHWQVVKRESGRKLEGSTVALSVGEAPEIVVRHGACAPPT